MKARRDSLLAAGALALTLCATGVAHAQDAPAGTFGAVTPQTRTTVAVVGENNVVRKLDQAGGQAISNAELFRVTWSPAGAGTLCVVTIKGATPAGTLDLAIYDNRAVYEYLIQNIRQDYAAHKPVFGTITQQDSMAGGFSRTETCRTPEHRIELVWTHLQTPNFTDISMFNDTVQMALTIIPATSGDIILDGKPAPGTWHAQGGGFGTGAYLALGETWRR